jgi:hypothetical protein
MIVIWIGYLYYSFSHTVFSFYQDYKEYKQHKEINKLNTSGLLKRQMKRIIRYNFENINNFKNNLKQKKIVDNEKEVHFIHGDMSRANHISLDVFRNAKRTKEDLEKLKELTRENFFDIKSNVKTFINPLAKLKSNLNSKYAKESELEKRKLTLYQRKQVQIELKISKINKINFLRNIILELRDSISDLQKLSGDSLSKFEESDLSSVKSKTISSNISDISELDTFNFTPNYMKNPERSRRFLISKKTFTFENNLENKFN